MQIFVREHMKILSKSKVAQVFLFFFSPPPHTLPLWLNTPQLIGALISFIFFFPEKSHRLVESKTVKGMFATRHGNTCPHSLPIAHQTHRPVDGCEPGWRLGRLNSISSAIQTNRRLLFARFSQTHWRAASFPDRSLHATPQQGCVSSLLPAPLWHTVVPSMAISLLCTSSTFSQPDDRT